MKRNHSNRKHLIEMSQKVQMHRKNYDEKDHL